MNNKNKENKERILSRDKLDDMAANAKKKLSNEIFTVNHFEFKDFEQIKHLEKNLDSVIKNIDVSDNKIN